MVYNLTLRIHVDGKRPRGRWWSATVVCCSIEKQWAANLTRERESTLVRLAGLLTAQGGLRKSGHLSQRQHERGMTGTDDNSNTTIPQKQQ